MHVCTHKYVSIYSRGMSPVSSSPTSSSITASPFLQLLGQEKCTESYVTMSPLLRFLPHLPSHFFDLPLPAPCRLVAQAHLLRDVMRHHHHLRSSGTSSSSSASPSSTTSTSTAIRRNRSPLTPLLFLPLDLPPAPPLPSGFVTSCNEA